MSNFDDVSEAIKSLTDSELLKLSFLISQRLGKSKSSMPNVEKIKDKGNADLQLFYKVMLEAIPDCAAWPESVHLLKVRTKATYRSVCKAYDQVNSVVDVLLESNKATLSGTSTKVMRVRLFGLFAEVAIQHLKANNIPISFRQVLSQSGRFLGLLDFFFPGYTKSGNLHLILKAKELRD